MLQAVPGMDKFLETHGKPSEFLFIERSPPFTDKQLKLKMKNKPNAKREFKDPKNPLKLKDLCHSSVNPPARNFLDETWRVIKRPKYTALVYILIHSQCLMTCTRAHGYNLRSQDKGHSCPCP